jgi:hypothetical protein
MPFKQLPEKRRTLIPNSVANLLHRRWSLSSNRFAAAIRNFCK